MAYGNINVPGVTVPELEDALANKVDKVSGKGLSTNDFTTAEKNTLAGLADIKDTDGNIIMHSRPVLGFVRNLDVNENLNDIILQGLYYAKWKEGALSESNYPEQAFGKLCVTQITSSAVIMQEFTVVTGSRAGISYTRVRENNVWSAWKQNANISDLENKINESLPVCFTPTVTRYLPPSSSVGYGFLELSSPNFIAGHFYTFFVTDPPAVDTSDMPIFHPALCAVNNTMTEVYCENFNGNTCASFLRAVGFKLS